MIGMISRLLNISKGKFMVNNSVSITIHNVPIMNYLSVIHVVLSLRPCSHHTLKVHILLSDFCRCPVLTTHCIHCRFHSCLHIVLSVLDFCGYRSTQRSQQDCLSLLYFSDEYITLFVVELVFFLSL